MHRHGTSLAVHFRSARVGVLVVGTDVAVMNDGLRRLERVGTFDGRAGSQDRAGRLNLADAMVDLSVAEEHEEPETGERIVELSVRAEFPANEIEVRFELPEHGADRLCAALEPRSS